MEFPRGSGILAHITSLPGRLGVGDLGPAALDFVDFLSRTGQTWWQVLPLGPTGYGNSPYQSLSSFAGNPVLISPEVLASEGWLTAAELSDVPSSTSGHVDFERVEPIRRKLLARAFTRFASTAMPAQRAELLSFKTRQAWWLDEYVLFAALKHAHDDQAWTKWEPRLVRRDGAAMQEWAKKLEREIELETFVQFAFDRQWTALKKYARDRGIRFIGDVPIFVAHDSADVWANQALFQLDERGAPCVVAGVPPDYFSSTGQLWGNPLYRWDVLAELDYGWWIQRLKRAFDMFDLVRLDHFRGFEAYWEIPGNAPDASTGRWVHGPGKALFVAAERQLGKLPLIAEDLGVITPPVEALRDELGFPGMRVLQFGFGDDPKGADYRPHNFLRHCVAYTGTHDNDTTYGWFWSNAGEGTTRSQEQIDRERAFILSYVGTDGREIHWDFIRLAWESVADTAIAPLQDLLGLGNEARMNLPGTIGNWTWQSKPGAITPAIEARLAEMTSVYQRSRTGDSKGNGANTV